MEVTVVRFRKDHKFFNKEIQNPIMKQAFLSLIKVHNRKMINLSAGTTKCNNKRLTSTVTKTSFKKRNFAVPVIPHTGLSPQKSDSIIISVKETIL